MFKKLQEELLIETKLKKEEVLELLLDNTYTEGILKLKARKSGKFFLGKVKDGKFQISRIINYRNSFLPIFKGTVTDSENGTVIYVNIGLHPFVKSFVGKILRSFLGFPILLIVFTIFGDEGSDKLPVMLSFIVAFIIVGFLMIFTKLIKKIFEKEKKQAKNFLTDLFL